MRISMIVAASENNVIGKNNELPWHLPLDLKFFKTTTKGHAVIMGRKTIESLGKPLPHRTNIVITHQKDYQCEGAIVVPSPEKAVELAKTLDNNEAFIIGGGEIFKLMLPLADRVYLTRVHAQVDGDAHFPVLPSSDWELTSEEPHPKDEKHQFAFTFRVFDRKK